jgi:hypothetical protein
MPINAGNVQQPVPPAIQQLFQAPTFNRGGPFVARGNLIIFNYSFWVHDPKPLVIVTGMKPGYRLFGVNINYLTFNTIKKLLWQKKLGNDKYIVDTAFREYKWEGIRQIRILDREFVIRVMSLVRSFDPADVEIIRRQVREMITRQVNPKAEAFPAQGQEMPGAING